MFNFVDDLSFRIAVGARFSGRKEKDLQYDPLLFRWLARIYSLDENGVETKEYLPLHDCNDEDLN